MRAVVRCLSVVALAVATAACGAAAPTPSPIPPAATTTRPATPASSSAPSASSTPAATATPIAVPTSTPTSEPTAPPTAPTPTPAQTAGSIDHPTDAGIVVLRVEQQGGFVMPSFVFARVPGFSLYGDGTIVYRPLEAPGTVFGDAFAPLQVAHMDEDHLQALLRFVLGAGRLANAKALYASDAGAGDIPSTVFTLAAGDFSKKVVVQALGAESPQVSVDDARDRAAFVVLRDFLEDFGKQVAAGQADAVGPYAPTAYIGELFPTGAPVDPASKPWPWPEITQQQLIVGPNDDQSFLVDLTPDQVAKLVPVPVGGLVGVQVAGPDKKGYSISIRPLLPDDRPGQMPTGAAPRG